MSLNSITVKIDRILYSVTDGNNIENILKGIIVSHVGLDALGVFTLNTGLGGDRRWS
ncbi:hypothetical protein KC947_03815 [Candidatus Saccharibacteria bacterium]|nr:hypothetical protein [Candidatus Saccharibacteria bacterium]